MIFSSTQNTLYLKVEVNTMASGAAGVACKVRELHQNMQKRFPDLLTPPKNIKGRLARNEAIQLVAGGLISAWEHYAKQVKFYSPK